MPVPPHAEVIGNVGVSNTVADVITYPSKADAVDTRAERVRTASVARYALIVHKGGDVPAQTIPFTLLSGDEESVVISYPTPDDRDKTSREVVVTTPGGGEHRPTELASTVLSFVQGNPAEFSGV